MYIKTFEDLRKYLVENIHIDTFVEWGYLGMFNPSARVDSAMFVLDKTQKNEDSTFIKLNDLYEGHRYKYFVEAYSDLCSNVPNGRVYHLPQSKLKEIKSYPFIYWISDEFRKKFGKNSFDDNCVIAEGCKTANNFKHLRFWWERNLIKDFTSQVYPVYAKGGEYCKWYGNLWLELLWGENGKFLKQDLKACANNEAQYFKEGITFTGAGTKGDSFRFLPPNSVFDTGARSIFPQNMSTLSILAILNSSLCYYVLNCLNPTVNTTVGDVKRIPFIQLNQVQDEFLRKKAACNIDIKKHLCSFEICEINFFQSPILPESMPKDSLFNYYIYENSLLTQILLNEAIINETVFEIYELSEHDRQMVLEKEGMPVGSLPVTKAAKTSYLQWMNTNTEFAPSEELIAYIQALPTIEDAERIDDFDILYQSHNDWEEFCIRHNVNPIEAWYQHKQQGVLPAQRTQTLAFELLTDVIRSVLAKDDDGVIPIVDRAGEEKLAVRIEAELIERGYQPAHISQLFALLGMPLDRYLQDRFFAQLSDHLNLFMYLPKTPFIWHITSGEHHALELYVSIYKWNRDVLFRLKSVYAGNREDVLKDRLALLQEKNDASAQLEAEQVRLQLKELKTFCDKVDDLLASGYDPKLDDGVGKNIAPLQKRNMVNYEVLNAGQLKKYLNADW